MYATYMTRRALLTAASLITTRRRAPRSGLLPAGAISALPGRNGGSRTLILIVILIAGGQLAVNLARLFIYFPLAQISRPISPERSAREIHVTRL